VLVKSVAAVQNLFVAEPLPVVRPALIRTFEEHWAVGQPSSPLHSVLTGSAAVTLGDKHLLKE